MERARFGSGLGPVWPGLVGPWYTGWMRKASSLSAGLACTSSRLEAEDEDDNVSLKNPVRSFFRRGVKHMFCNCDVCVYVVGLPNTARSEALD